jgi:Amidohydrolase
LVDKILGGRLGMRLGGFGFHEEAEPPSSATLAAAWRPYVETCIDAFGPSRAMFESNFPVDKGSYSYPVFWNACKLLAKGASEAEKADLFAGTAALFLSPQRNWRRATNSTLPMPNQVNRVEPTMFAMCPVRH